MEVLSGTGDNRPLIFKMAAFITEEYS